MVGNPSSVPDTKTLAGCVKNVREVCMEQGEQLEDNRLGIAGGGVVGGVKGSF
jgi:outer membrane lipoprotein SlyB